MGKPQLGTWTSHAHIPVTSLFPVPRTLSSPLNAIQAATLSVNPGTAYRMLRDFVPLKRGDWVLQNGANSQVGLAVIQIAREWGLKSINFVRDRDNIESLRSQMQALGADHVVTYSELGDKGFKSRLADWTSSSHFSLALNCVGGPDASNMAKLLHNNGSLVTYGAMSKQPLSLPSSLFIFKNLKSLGFWMTTWYATCTKEARMDMTNELVRLMETGKLKGPETHVVELGGSDKNIAETAIEAIETVKGKKVIFRFSPE